jgi:hypothetical protein
LHRLEARSWNSLMACFDGLALAADDDWVLLLMLAGTT